MLEFVKDEPVTLLLIAVGGLILGRRGDNASRPGLVFLGRIAFRASTLKRKAYVQQCPIRPIAPVKA